MARISLPILLALSWLCLPASGDDSVLSSAGTTAEWPQYRGPNRDGVSAEKGLRRSWPEDGPLELWRRAIGPGFAGIIANGERLYTADSDAEGEYVVAIDRSSGRDLWRTRLGPAFANSFGDGPRATPTLDPATQTLFQLSGFGRLVALDLDGEERWSVDLQKAFDVEQMRFGFSTAPLLLDDRVIVEIGADGGRSVAAFKKRNGDLVWTAGHGDAAYGSPIAIEFAGHRQLVFLNRGGAMALGPGGEELWNHTWATDGGVKPALPIFVAPDLLVFSASYDIGALALRLKSEDGRLGVDEVWRSRTLRNHFNSSVLVDGAIFGFDGSTLKSLDPQSGETHWAKRGRLGKGSLIAADDLLIVLSETGTLLLVEASTEAYRELASAQVLSGRCWTSPTLASGRLYLRNREERVALDLDNISARSPSKK